VLAAALHDYITRTVPALDVDAYSEKVYLASRAADL
jgi:hypothetical protein